MLQLVLNPVTGWFDLVDTSGGSGSGNVTGVPPTTQNAVVRWDNTTGTLIQNSTAILDDNGELHLLAVLQQDTIPPLVTLTVNPGEVYIMGSELNMEGTVVMGGTIVLI